MLDHAVRLLTPPAIEPVTLDQAKKAANVVVTDDDAFVSGLITTARELVEERTSRALITQTWMAVLQSWPAPNFRDPNNHRIDYSLRPALLRWNAGLSWRFELPRPPLIGVDWIHYIDVQLQTQTLSTDQYLVDAVRQPGVIWQNPQQPAWPLLGCIPNPVTIQYQAGYGATAAAVPGRAKQAILLLVAHWYRCREAVGQVGDEVALSFEALVRSLRVGTYP